MFQHPKGYRQNKASDSLYHNNVAGFVDAMRAVDVMCLHALAEVELLPAEDQSKQEADLIAYRKAARFAKRYYEWYATLPDDSDFAWSNEQVAEQLQLIAEGQETKVKEWLLAIAVCLEQDNYHDLAI